MKIYIWLSSDQMLFKVMGGYEVTRILMDLKKRRVQSPETTADPRGEVRRRGNQPQSMRRGMQRKGKRTNKNDDSKICVKNVSQEEVMINSLNCFWLLE